MPASIGHSVRSCRHPLSPRHELGQPGATEEIDVGKLFEPVSDVLAKFIRGGGRIGICKSCMIHNGFTEAQMAAGYEIVSAPRGHRPDDGG